MRGKNKNLIFLIAFLFGILVLNLFLGNNLLSAQQVTYCAEKTTAGFSCQDVPLSEVNTAYRYSQTSCDSTAYCQTGTCVDTNTGKCLSAGQATCNSNEGGTWYSSMPSDTPVCQSGCCLIGDQASFTTKAGCDVLASNAGISPNFDATVSDENTCISMARPKARGACVYETSNGRTCDFTTRQDCQKVGTDPTFYEGFLCTNPTLGTNCVRTKQTTCLDTSSQVFFIDSCGNPANVYDSSKTEDINYWSYLAGSLVGMANGIAVTPGDGAGNIGSASNGNCNYYLGSTCMQYDREIDPPAPGLIGDNICRSVNCEAGTFANLFKGVHGRVPYNGETWCGEATPTSIKLTSGNPGVSSSEFLSYDKSSNLPGSTEVLFTCANGRITTEVNAAYRSKTCVQTTNDNGYIGASFIVNNWQDCYFQNNSKSCLDTTKRDCKWITGASLLKDADGSPQIINDESQGFLASKIGDITGLAALKREVSCVPKFPPGFDPSVTQTDLSSQSICGLANRNCYVNYSKGIGGDWYVVNNIGDLFGGDIICLDDDEDLVSDWKNNMANLCSSLGDCGLSVNYVGRSGSNIEKDIFTIVEGESQGIL